MPNDSLHMNSLDLDTLRLLCTTNPQCDLYQRINFDYQREVCFQNSGKYAREREKFLKTLRGNSQPSSEIIRRLFNQVNCSYAEHFLKTKADQKTIGYSTLMELNEIVLFRQGKQTGFRKKNIGFGTRNYLPFADPRRNYKWMYGMPPEYLEEIIHTWIRLANSLENRTLLNAIALSLIFLGIHPFTDGNGRFARLLFTEICRTWDLGEVWLDEGQDGELLRTGFGIESTEYKLASYLIQLSNHANVIDPSTEGRPTSVQKHRIRNELHKKLLKGLENEKSLTDSSEFESIWSHLKDDGHFRSSSPRFESISTLFI